MKTMFDAVTLGTLELKNRLIRSATLEIAGAQDGEIQPLLGEIYNALADGGVGLIITGMMGVSPNSCLGSSMVKAYSATFLGRLRAIVDGVHAKGAKIVVQLGHTGAYCAVRDGAAEHAFAPSDFERGKLSAKAMTQDEIRDLVLAYGAAAKMCKAAGADGVQLHAAHGYLFSQFLSPIFNQRTDEYGGEIANRARVLLDAYGEIRSQVGDAYPVLVKINYTDLYEGGISEEDALWCCKELDRRGIDAIEVSAGISLDRASSAVQPGRQDEAFNAAYALRVASEVGCAVISVGGYRSRETVEGVLNQGGIAAVALCRPLIREPGLPNRWREGKADKATCISCAKCFKSPRHGCYLDLEL